MKPRTLVKTALCATLVPASILMTAPQSFAWSPGLPSPGFNSKSDNGGEMRHYAQNHLLQSLGFTVKSSISPSTPLKVGQNYDIHLTITGGKTSSIDNIWLTHSGDMKINTVVDKNDSGDHTGFAETSDNRAVVVSDLDKGNKIDLTFKFEATESTGTHSFSPMLGFGGNIESSSNIHYNSRTFVTKAAENGPKAETKK